MKVDVTLEPEDYIERDPYRCIYASRLAGFAVLLSVPMLHEDKLVGVIHDLSAKRFGPSPISRLRW